MTQLILALSGSREASLPTATLRRMVGPGLMVAVGYMDPGNWATDIAGGAGFGYRLLAVVMFASLLAMGLQVLVARLALATGEDLASLTRQHLPAPVAKAAWLAGEAAILATALAELIGGGIALNLLLGLPLPAGVVLTAIGTISVLSVSRLRSGAHEQLVGALVAGVALAFLLLLAKIGPDWGAAAQGVAHTGSALADPKGLMIALGILGATLMPHNLYLHGSEIARRAQGLGVQARIDALRVTRNDTLVSLTLAMAINGAIMIVAAASLTGAADVSSLGGAYAAMREQLGPLAAIAFGVALYAAGQSSAITGVMAGSALTRGFRGETGSERLRGIVTRLAAVTIALAFLAWRGVGDPDGLLVLSQVVLGLALPFALVPLAWLACRSELMGRLALGGVAKVALVSATTLIVLLDLYLVGASF